MELINRSALIVRHKKPFLDWVNSSGDTLQFNLQTVNEDNNVYLLPEYDTDKQLNVIIKKVYQNISQVEFEGYNLDPETWPKLDYKGFLEWFSIEVNSMVIDTLEGDIEKEEY